jgi:hypothetical protein
MDHMKEVELHKVLVKGMAKRAADDLAAMANSNPELYLKLLDAIASGEQTHAMKASWVLGHAARMDKNPAQKHGHRLLQLLLQAKVGGVQREILKVLELVSLSEEDEGRFVDLCFELLRRPGLDVAIRYYCLRVLRQKVKKYPELKIELVSTLEEIRDWHNDVWTRYSSKAILSLLKAGSKR